jgi:hypothetical protein
MQWMARGRVFGSFFRIPDRLKCLYVTERRGVIGRCGVIARGAIFRIRADFN